jgi:hypothetical protein
LIGRTLLPSKALVAAVPLRDSEMNETARRISRKDWPAGRIEVTGPARGGATTFFLHLLTPCDAGDPDPSCEFAEQGGQHVLHIGASRLAFSADGRTCRIESR